MSYACRFYLLETREKRSEIKTERKRERGGNRKKRGRGEKRGLEINKCGRRESEGGLGIRKEGLEKEKEGEQM